ncbi:MAG: 2-amino-4-hydroxy-6-hydroxymethyldihydropteridine diphosphokinase [Gammaproteobacteria bacterium]|nr:2-amino-4-hydroxy-6-hydroxymethyldihydropteridine diphosphokinase [Gammaproteobacteria bacterium]
MSSNRITAYIGLGANLGHPLRQIENALWRLDNSAGIQVIAVSDFYRSKALLAPDAAPQPDYINAAALLKTSLPVRWLLQRLLFIEQKLGRTRGQRWAPRTLDLDLLLYGQQRYQLPNLTVPHAAIHKRAFVLYPLRDLAPNLVVPGLGSLQRLLRRCDRSEITVCRTEQGPLMHIDSPKII